MVYLDSVTQLWRNPPNLCHVTTRGKRLDGRLGWGASRGLYRHDQQARREKSENNATTNVCLWWNRLGCIREEEEKQKG